MPLDAPLDMENFENNIHTWFATATGLEIVWKPTRGPRPPYPYGSLMHLSGPVTPDTRWELREDYDVTRATGKEIRGIVCIQASFVISCHVYVNLEDSRYANYDARSFLNKAFAALSTPTRQAVFLANDIAYVSATTINIPQNIVADTFLSEAILDVTFAAAMNAEEYYGYFDKVNIQSTGLGVNYTIDGS